MKDDKSRLSLREERGSSAAPCDAGALSSDDDDELPFLPPDHPLPLFIKLRMTSLLSERQKDEL